MNSTNRPFAAALWMLGTITAFALMAVSGRTVLATHDTFEVMAWRSLIGFLIVLGMTFGTGRRHLIRTNRLPRHLMRNLAHFTGQNLWFLAIALIPLGQVFALEFTAPIWLILFAPIFLGERLTRPKLIAAGFGLAGTILVARPDFTSFQPGVAAAALAAIFFATTNMTTKALTRHEPTLSIVFWLTGMQLIMGLIMAGYDGEMTLPTRETLPWLVLIGLCGLTAHYCLTMALSLAPASTIIPFDFLRLPLAFALGWLLYGEALDILILLGAALILIGIIINLRASQPARDLRPPPINRAARQHRPVEHSGTE